jgi:hypothetical protein
MSELKYKEGDKVLIKDVDWYNENKTILGNIECGDALMTFEKARFCGKIVTISNVSDITDTYGIEEDNGLWRWTDEMIEGLVEEETKPKYEDEVNGEYYSTPKYMVRPSGYQFVDENGNVINATKIVLEKKPVEEKYSDVKIQIFGNVVILKGGINADNPTEYMNEVVHYILNLLGNPKHNQFIEEYLDNPWVRILIFDFNSMEFNNSFDDIVTNFKRQ